MHVVCFRYWGKYGHFLRAEANANGITYPYPSRPALLGLIAAVLGLAKDEAQLRLAEAKLAVGGRPPQRFWHRTHVRKDPPARIPWEIKAKDLGTSREQRTFRFPQEWLWRPDYRVWAALPATHHTEFVARLRERRWHFTPVLGLASLFADLEVIAEAEARLLPAGTHSVLTLTAQGGNEIDLAALEHENLEVVSIRMPAAAAGDRVFTHKTYWFEQQGQPLPLRTAEAWQCGSQNVVFL